MKKIILRSTTIYCCIQLSSFFLPAQVLYGPTFKGGDYEAGVINKLVPRYADLSVVKSFEGLPATPLYTNFIQGGDGKLYGMTAEGGNYNFGVIFSFDPSSFVYTKLKDFDNTNGGKPNGSLMEASDGKFYGMTLNGGNSNTGVIFSFDPVSFVYTKLKDFNEADGAYPYGNLIQAKDGKLYGMTSSGGSNNFGVVFSFDLSSSTYSRLVDLDRSNGAAPFGSLMQADNGKLYGMTVGGGSSGAGVIFSYDPYSANYTNYTKLWDFNYPTGGNPFGNLIQANDGKLYGMTSAGGSTFINGGTGVGVIFSFNISSSVYKKIKDFNNSIGAAPYGSLTQGNDGKLYGLTEGDGSGSAVIFSFDPSSFAYKKIKGFINSNPFGSLMKASDGKLYGMTSAGGINGGGIIFSYDPPSSIYKKLKDISSNESGSNISGSLVQATNGKLYGMTLNGGSNGIGVIFSFDPYISAYKKIWDFDSTNGANPYGSLVQAADGKLYGMTHSGGSGGYGTIFSFDPSSLLYTRLVNFDNVNGSYPYGSLTIAADGKFYGMTYGGGKNGAGVIFSFDPFSSTYTKLLDFDKINGAHPYGNLLQAMDGNFYGITSGGGTKDRGVIFSFDASSSIYKKIKDFSGTNGAKPYGSLIQASDKRLYGTTSAGGVNDLGVIFCFDLSSFTYTKLKEFSGSNGATPYGSLMQASDGKLYGTTSAAIGTFRGSVFSIDTFPSPYATLAFYNSTNGATPYIGSAFIEIKESPLNKPPRISITHPLDNAPYLIPVKNLIITAAASDSDGTISKVEFYNDDMLLGTATAAPYSFAWQNIPAGNYTLTAKAMDNDGNVTTSAPVHISVAYNTPPTVSLVSPVNNRVYLRPANIHLEAMASDVDGNVTKVEFYNGTKLLQTSRIIPYHHLWTNVDTGHYVITARATDNWGAVTVSDPIYISVVFNQPPAVSIINPVTEQNFSAPATINLQAAATDADGRITKVEFYNGTILLQTSRVVPYHHLWENISAGTYTVTAIATDNWGAKTTSDPVTITVTSTAVTMARSQSQGNVNAAINNVITLKLAPNPVNNMLNIYTSGLQKKQTTISIISSSGVILKKIEINNLTQTLKLNVASLASGVYTIKMVCDDKILYRQFVKL